jgi:phage baseplate assembly protein W
MANSTSIDVYGVVPEKQKKLEITSRSKKSYGFSFPMGLRKGGGDFNNESGISLLKNNVEQLLLTDKGERLMLKSYGMGLKKYLFEPLTADLFNQIKHEIIIAIEQFMPEVDIAKVSVVQSDTLNVEGGMGLVITLTLIATEFNNDIFNVGVTVV